MKSYELEAFIKSFLLFFILQSAFLAHIIWHQYKVALNNLDNKILSEMKICSLDLKCKNYTIDFIKKPLKYKENSLYKDEKKVYMLFNIPTVKDYLLQIYLNKSTYLAQIKELKMELLKHHLIYIIFILLSSSFFAFYSLNPLRKALNLNEEFIKDILHDINTPISALIVNLKLLQKEFGENKRVLRIRNSIDTIISLQENLKAFLFKSKLQKERIKLKELITQRVKYFQSIYPHIKFTTDIKKESIFTNRDSFIRIIDNIISNSCKYSKKENAQIKIYTTSNALVIEDNGIGIKNSENIFKRYYKEQNRGLGLGMHIVKKLCNELKMDIKVESRLNQGTKVILTTKW